MNRNPVKLPEFMGKPGESLQTFLNQMANGARLGAWTPEYPEGMLYAQLRGGALHYAESLPERDREDHGRFVAALRQQYEGGVARERAKESLRAIRRGRNESLADLDHRIAELARKAYPADQREEEGVLAVRNAVSDKLAEHIVLQRYRKMDECLNALTRLECHIEMRNRNQARISQAVMKEDGTTPSQTNRAPSKVAQKAPAPPVDKVPPVANLVTVEQLREALSEFQKDLTDKLRRTEPRKRPHQPTGGPSEDRLCNWCGAADHWARECPKRQRQGKDSGLAPDRSGNQSKQ